MSKLFLSLHKMTPIKSDKNTSTFEHSDGHQVIVKHNSLSPKMRSELQDLVKTKMAKGGEVNHRMKETPTAPPKLYAYGTDDVSQSDPTLDQTNPNLPPEGGASHVPSQDPTQDPTAGIPQANDEAMAKDQYSKQIASATDINGKPFTPEQVAKQTDEQMASDKNAQERAAKHEAATKANKAAQDAMIPTLAAREGAPMPPAATPAPEAARTPAQDQVPAYTNPYAAQPSASPTGADDYLGMAKGIKDEISGIRGAANAQQKTAEAANGALLANEAARNEATAHDQDNMNKLEAERQGIMHDIQEGHIDPNQYLNDMGTGGKIATGIGLILGGIGGGLTGQENPAMKFLNSQIDRNIHAQQSELGKKENLLSANFKQFGNLQAAKEFTRINMNDMLKSKIEQAAASNGGALAQSMALQHIGEIEKTNGMLMAKVGAMTTMNSPQSKEGDVQAALQRARMVAPDLAKEYEARYVPSVGVGQVPIPSDIRGKITAQNQLDERAKDLLNFVKSNTGSFNPKVVGPGQEKVLAIQALYREGMLGTVYKAGEQPLLDRIVKDPTSFFNDYTNVPKLEELVNSNKATLGTLKSNYGIRPFAGSAPEQTQRPKVSFKPR